MRIDPLLVIAAALAAGAYLCTAFWPALVAFLIVLGMLRVFAGVSWACCALVAIAFAFGGARAALSLAQHERLQAETREWIAGPKRCAANGVVQTSPAITGDTLAFTAELTDVDCEGRQQSGPLRVRLYSDEANSLARGDRFFAVTQLAVPQVFHNGELQDPGPSQVRQGVVLSGSVLALEPERRGAGIGNWIDRLRAHAHQRILATFSPNAVGMAEALVLGTGDLSDDDAEAFRQSGLAHLLAVSGTHLVFAVLGLLRVVRFYLLRVQGLALRFEMERVVAALGVVLAPVYADFAGGSGSAWRAAWMLSAALLVKAFGRRPFASRALAASILLGALYDAMVAYDISFRLSLAATAGLLMLGKRLRAWMGSARWRVVQLLQSAALATLCSMLPCVPLLALLSPDLSWASIGANVIAAPLGEAVALPLCLLHGVTSLLPPLELGIARVASGSLIAIDQIAHASADVKWMRFSVPLPSPWQLAVAITGGIGLLVLITAQRPLRRRWAVLWAGGTLLVIGALELTQYRSGNPHNLLRITAVDVGQGDATLIDLPQGKVMLIDGGGIVGSPIDPGRRILEPLLRARRRERIDVMVLSHPHPDHFLGLLRIAQRFSVDELWDTGQGEAQGAGPLYAQLLATLRQQGTRIRRPGELCGSKQLSGATINVLAPCPRFVEGRGPNDNSFVLRISYGSVAALLVGDAEHAEETQLLAHGDRLNARFLKVGHHGSRTSSSPEFLAAVAPQYASISCGVRNSFGHPHAVTLDHLQAQGVAVFRLDRIGSVIWQTDGVRDELLTSSVRENPLWSATTSLLSTGG